jgi:hypothetical protein
MSGFFRLSLKIRFRKKITGKLLEMLLMQSKYPASRSKSNLLLICPGDMV